MSLKKIHIYKPGEIERAYDKRANAYDILFSSKIYHAPPAVCMRLCETFHVSYGQPRILDIGIGTGQLADQCRKQYPEAHISGVDSSSEMLKRCEAKGIADSLSLRNIEREGLGYDDNSFDVVVSSGVFELIADLEGVIGEVSRVLAPGGAFSFTSLCDSMGFGGENEFTAEEIDDYIAKAGLTLNERAEITGYKAGGVNVEYMVNTGTKQASEFVVPGL